MSTINQNIINLSINEFINGDKEKAIKKLSKYLKKNNSDYSAKHNLGYMYDQINNYNQAISCYKDASELKHNYWQSRLNLSIIYIKLENYPDALIYINQVLQIKNNYQPALRDKALILHKLDNQDEALKLINQSLSVNPLDYIAINTLGLIHLKLEEIEIAEKIFKKGIDVNNKYAPSFSNLGRCYESLNLPEKAIEFFLKAEKIDPNSHITLNNIAGYYVDTSDYKKGLDYYFKALKIYPKNPMIIANIAKTYFYLEEYINSKKWILKCLKLDNKNSDFKKTYGIFLFKDHDYKNAWEYYEARLNVSYFGIKNQNAKNVNNFLWNGKVFKRESKILIIKEQGIGDEILYASMYEEILKKYKDVKIESDPKLITIFKKNFKDFNNNIFFPFGYFSSNRSKLSKFNIVLYAGSLGKLFRNNISNFPKNNYLKIKKGTNNEINSFNKKLEKKFKIGLSWKSFRKKITTAQAKSLKLLDFKPLFEVNNLSFINLQYGDTKEEINHFNYIEKNNIITLNSIDLFNDLESVACLLQNIDLLITVSNTTAHLAGALGIETWLIKGKNHASFHYWNQKSNKTPWYNSIKIYDANVSSREALNQIKIDLINKFNPE